MNTLTLAEELLLLAYEEESGRRMADGTSLGVGVAGSLLADLALAERVDLDGERVTVLDRAPVGDPDLDDALGRMAAEPKPRKPEWWIERLGKQKKGGKALSQRLLDRLVERGVLRAAPHRVLGLFPTTRYAELDPSAEREIRSRLYDALNGAAPTPRTAALVALMDACDLARKVFPDLDKKLLKRRAKEITDGEWAGAATRKVIQNIRAAAAASAAVTAATTAATVST